MKHRRVGCIGAVILMILLYGIVVSIQAPRLHRDAELIRAIERHDSAQTLVLLQQGVSPNTRQHVAHRTGWQGILEQFGWQPHVSINPTALAMACGAYGTPSLSTVVIEEMMKRGADIGGKDSSGFPPLFYALNSENDGAVLALIRGGADWRALPITFSNPLELAIKHGNTALFEELLAHGIDPNQRNLSHETALEQTLQFPGPEGETRIKIMTALIAHGAGVNAPFRNGQPPLSYAALRGELPEVGLLLAHGADIDGPDAQGNTPLMVQIPNSDEKMTRFLLAHGAKVNPKNMSGQTALMVACAAWPAPDMIVPDLLKTDAEINVQDSHGDTALIMACRWQGADPRMVAQLLAHGADVSLRNAKGETALTSTLAHSPDPDTVRLLRQALAKSGKNNAH